MSGLTDLIDRGSTHTLKRFFAIALWAALFGWGVWSWLPEALPGVAYRVTLGATMGGVAFGVGAAINGGCFFGTIARLGTGDLSFLATFAGLAIGAMLERPLSWLADLPEPAGPTLAPPPALLVLGLLAALLLGRPVAARFRPSDEAGRAAEVAVPLVGGSGSFLFTLHGAWVYPFAVDPLTGPGGILVLSSATLCGACLAAIRGKSFRLRLSWPALPHRVGGGAAMGLGATLIPGGNGTLVLQGLPSLSPHAPFAYAALVLGAGLTLILSPRLRRAAALATRA